jgi:hypothetical protein
MSSAATATLVRCTYDSIANANMYAKIHHRTRIGRRNNAIVTPIARAMPAPTDYGIALPGSRPSPLGA